MKILIVGLVNNQQLTRVKEEATKRGHELEGVYSADLVVETSNKGFRALIKSKLITQYDVIYLWAISKRRWEWYTAAIWANKGKGTKIVNQKIVDGSFDLPLAAAPIVDYYKQIEKSLPMPHSVTIFSKKTIPTFIDQFEFPVIVKASKGSGGKYVRKAEDATQLRQHVVELLKDSPAVIVREFIPNDGDIRIFTVGYKAIGAMKRIPPAGDFRANISGGGTAKPFDLTKRDDLVEIAQKASRAVQVDIAGVDIILHKKTKEPYILEVNPGPQFLGLEKYTETNVAEEIIKFFEKLHN